MKNDDDKIELLTKGDVFFMGLVLGFALCMLILLGLGVFG